MSWTYINLVTAIFLFSKRSYESTHNIQEQMKRDRVWRTWTLTIYVAAAEQREVATSPAEQSC